jgi:chromosome segregation ATPase
MQQTQTSNSQQSEQFAYLKERVRGLEGDLEKALREKTDAACEVRRLTALQEGLEREMKELRVKEMSQKGDSQTVSATAQRLQSQLQGKQGDIELLMRAKEELEKLVQVCKKEAIDSEKKAAEYYQ